MTFGGRFGRDVSFSSTYLQDASKDRPRTNVDTLCISLQRESTLLEKFDLAGYDGDFPRVLDSNLQGMLPNILLTDLESAFLMKLKLNMDIGVHLGFTSPPKGNGLFADKVCSPPSSLSLPFQI